MAEVTKGRENLQEAIAACEEANTALASAGAPEAVKAHSDLQEVLQSLHDVSEKFFLKTMMSIPPTNVCKTEATAVAAVIAAQKWEGLPAAVVKLQKAAKALETKAKMDGTTIT
jgi:hypothetical protein